MAQTRHNTRANLAAARKLIDRRLQEAITLIVRDRPSSRHHGREFGIGETNRAAHGCGCGSGSRSVDAGAAVRCALAAASALSGSGSYLLRPAASNFLTSRAA